MNEHERALSGDDPLVPPIGVLPPAERMFRVLWLDHLRRAPGGAPYLTPDYVAGLGRRARIIDTRGKDELVGATGYIPGSDWIPKEKVLEIVSKVHRDDALILVSNEGHRALVLAQQLENAGLRMVAALLGGVHSWRLFGFETSRDPALLEREGQLRPLPAYREPQLRPLQRDEVEAHIGDPFAVRKIRFAGLLQHGLVSCVDGRDESGVIGTPGGDAGEFLLLLAALEQVREQPLTREEVRGILHRRMDTFGRFYMHTDTSAANALIGSLRSDRRLDSVLKHVNETHHWRDFFQCPPEEARSILLEHMLREPGYVGCGHLRLARVHAEKYMVRKSLSELFLEEYFRLRWNGQNQAEMVALSGGHREAAVLNVLVEGGIEPFVSVPLVSPTMPSGQAFINHPQVSSFFRRQSALFVERQGDLLSLPRGGADRLYEELEAIGAVQARMTLQRLAAGLPVFHVTFRTRGRVLVEAAGVIPGIPGGAH